jgi:hypothetical protein
MRREQTIIFSLAAPRSLALGAHLAWPGLNLLEFLFFSFLWRFSFPPVHWNDILASGIARSALATTDHALFLQEHYTTLCLDANQHSA